MKDNFNTKQITNDYIDAICKKPSKEGIKNYFKDLFDRISQESVHLQWNSAHHKYRNFVTILISILTYIIISSFLMAGLIPTFTWKHMLSIGISTFTGYAAWDQFSGFYFQYRFGKEVICTRRTDNRPEIVYKVVRVFAWFGVALCVVMGLIFGPMIFVGAGGFALMAFHAINIKNNIVIYRIPYNSIIYIQYIVKDNEVEVLFKNVLVGINNNRYLDFSEDFHVESFYLKNITSNELIDFINKKVGYAVDYIEVEKRSDKINLFKKARTLGIKLETASIELSSLNTPNDISS